jgi:hypothetical protein
MYKDSTTNYLFLMKRFFEVANEVFVIEGNDFNTMAHRLLRFVRTTQGDTSPADALFVEMGNGMSNIMQLQNNYNISSYNISSHCGNSPGPAEGSHNNASNSGDADNHINNVANTGTSPVHAGPKGSHSADVDPMLLLKTLDSWFGSDPFSFWQSATGADSLEGLTFSESKKEQTDEEREQEEMAKLPSITGPSSLESKLAQLLGERDGGPPSILWHKISETIRNGKRTLE